MILNEKPEYCCGCSACKSICPKQAISMQPDALGFLYPKIDSSKCVNCGLCEKVCAFNDHYDISLNLSTPQAYGIRHKNLQEIEKSRSGAAFVALSDFVLENGGAVYGAGYSDCFRVIHKRAETKEARDEFRGSKYVQSDMEDVFAQVKNDLQSGRQVVFSGTGCQVAGLNSYIGPKLRKNLYLVDIVCHGVPSPYIWRDYLKYLEEKEKDKIISVNFRDKKKFGWAAHKESFQFENKCVTADSYTYLFYRHIMFRQSCGICYFANLNRPGDVTIADFWGWKKIDSNFNTDDKGSSLILCNTEKGLEWFASCKKDLHWIPVKLEDCKQRNLHMPSKISKDRMKFERDYKRKGFNYVLFRYGNVGPIYKIRKIGSVVKRILKKIF